jgi:hypothetical protein
MRLKRVAVAVAALAPVVPMRGYNVYAMWSQRTRKCAHRRHKRLQASSEVDRIVEELHSLLISVRSMPAVQNLDAAVCNASLRSVASSIPNIRMIFVLDLQGTPVCGSVETPAGVTFADRDYFKAAMAGQDFVVGTYTKSRMSETSVLPVAMPVVVDGATGAVVVSGVNLDCLQNRIAERGAAPGIAVTIANSGGTILARVPQPERFVGTVIPDDVQELVHASEPGVIEVKSQDGTERVLGYRPILPDENPLDVSAGFSKEEEFAPINRATTINVVAIAAGVLAAMSQAALEPVGRHLRGSPPDEGTRSLCYDSCR